jgi:hypothetical protein
MVSEGSREVLIRGIDLFSGDPREGTYYFTKTMDIPIINRTVCQLVSGPQILNSVADFLKRLVYNRRLQLIMLV